MVEHQKRNFLILLPGLRAHHTGKVPFADEGNTKQLRTSNAPGRNAPGSGLAWGRLQGVFQNLRFKEHPHSARTQQPGQAFVFLKFGFITSVKYRKSLPRERQAQWEQKAAQRAPQQPPPRSHRSAAAGRGTKPCRGSRAAALPHTHSPQSEIITFCFGFPSLVP